MARLTKAQRKQQYKDNTIDRLLSNVQEDSRQQAQEVARLYREGKFRNWITAKNLLTRFAGESKKSRTWARKAVEQNKDDWEKHRIKDKTKIEKVKNREKVAAVSKIATKFKQYRFKQQRIVESVEVGDTAYKAISNNVINFKLNRAYPELPASDADGRYMINPTKQKEPHPDTEIGNVKDRIKAVVLELVSKMLHPTGHMKLQLVLRASF